MNHVRRIVSDLFNEAWQTLKKKTVAVVLAVLLPVAYDIFSFTTCETLHTINNGTIDCVGNWYNNSVGATCSFSCDKNYQLMGEEKIKCNEAGNWTHEIPKCLKVCGDPPKTEHGQLKCNGTVVGSTCTLECDKSRKAEGASHIYCDKDGKWHGNASTCICANPCRTGEKCDKLLSWQEFKHYINEDGGTSYLNFDDHPIKCAYHFHFEWIELKWACRCIDITSRHEVLCKGYASRYGACEHSSAELIRQMVAKNVYSPPCDPDRLMTGC